MSMGPKLAAARKAAGLTQEQLAERLGVSRQAVSRWESDAAYPETDKIVRMARLLAVSCDYLLRDDVAANETAPPPPDPVTRLLRQAAGRKVQIGFYDGAEGAFGGMGLPSGAGYCVIREFDGAWADVEYVKPKKGTRENYLIPISSIRTITFRKEE